MHVDTLLDRIQLKQRVRVWRLSALGVAVVAGLVIAQLTSASSGNPISAQLQHHIARVKIEGVIEDNPDMRELLDGIAENDKVSALIVEIDSPGGTASGGQEIYMQLRDIGKTKPVVAVMRGMATSGGYMAALGADYIVARESTITGSIGVILEAAEFTELAKKIGVEPIVVKSGPFKASPNPAEKFTPAQRAGIQSVIDDFHRYFKAITAERRKLPAETVAELAQGQIYSGTQALKNKLIDAIGGEQEALAWLEKEKSIDPELPIWEAKLPEEEAPLFEKISALAIGKPATDMLGSRQGLMAIWRP